MPSWLVVSFVAFRFCSPKDPGVAAMSRSLLNFVYYHPGISREVCLAATTKAHTHTHACILDMLARQVLNPFPLPSSPPLALLQQAEALMKGHPFGTYLLRDAGSNHRGFSLSAIDRDMNLRHFRVLLKPTNKLQVRVVQGANTTCQAPNFSLTSKTRPLRACTHSHALAPLSCWSCCHRLCTVSLCLMTCSPSLTTTVHRTLAAQQRAVSSPSPATSKSHMTDVHRCRHALRFKPACLSPLSKQTHMKHVCLHFTCRPFFIAHTHTQTHTHTHSLSLSLFLPSSSLA